MKLRSSAFLVIGASLLALSAQAEESPAPSKIKATSADTANSSVKVMSKKDVEERDRLVDRAALEAQNVAISKLKALLVRYAGQMQEPLLLGRMAESYQQAAAIQFRIAHGRAHRGGGAVDLTEYRKTMKLSITTLDHLIASYPNFENIQEAWFLRGKGYEEIEKKTEARRDYLHLVTQWPDALQAPPAYMSLAQFAIDENKHEEAIKYLEAVEQRPNDPQYPFALYKLAWSHYNLKHVAAALGYLERHLDFYAKRLAASQFQDPSDTAIRENSLADIALFYLEGVDMNDSNYTAMGALPYFRKIEKGAALGKMLSRFARLLRAHNRDKDLEDWNRLVMNEEMGRPESLDVAMTVFEERVNRRRFEDLDVAAKDFEKIVDANRKNVSTWESYTKTQDLLVRTIEELRALTIKNKKATQIGTLSQTLANLSLSFIHIVDAKDPRVPGVHYNLAETLFEISDFERATTHYRWVVENWKDGKSFDLKNASLRAISSRYEILHGKKIIPTELAAKALPAKDVEKVDPMLEEWVTWIDDHAQRFLEADVKAKKDKDVDVFENFEFEGNRGLYIGGQIARASERMQKFAERSPASQYAIPSATLVLDTAILSGNWQRTFELARDLEKVKGWVGTEFHTRLAKVEADAWFKIVEGRFEKKDAGEALAASKTCVDKYKDSDRYSDCLFMAARASLVLKDEKDGEKYLDRTIQEKPDSESARLALLERGRLHERNYRFAKAFADDQAFLAKGGQASDVSSRLIPLAWLANDWRELARLTQAKDMCNGDSAKLCSRSEAVLTFEDPTYKASDASLRAGLAILDSLRKRPEEIRAIWALIGLQDRSLGFKDRTDLLKAVAEGWSKLDPSLQLSLLYRMTTISKNAIAANRQILRASFPLKADKNSIKKRLDRVQELEEVAVNLMKLPWIRLRVEILSEVASAYSDVGDALRVIPAPKELPESERGEYEITIQKLAMPFDEKAVDLRSKAFEVASNSGVESETFSPLADAYFKDNPSQMKAFEEARKPAAVDTLQDVALLSKLDPQGRWFKFRKDSVQELRVNDDKGRAIAWSWWEALQSGNFAQVSFFQSEAATLAKAESNKKDGESDEIHDARVREWDNRLAVMRFFTLSKAGALGEALNDLSDARKKMDNETRQVARDVLLNAYRKTGAMAKVAQLQKEVARVQ